MHIKPPCRPLSRPAASPRSWFCRGLALACLPFLAACRAVAADDPLQGPWLVAPASAAGGPEETEGLAFEPVADLGKLAVHLPGGEGFIWLKHEFSLPPRLAGKETGLLLGHISMADRTWLNGRLLGGEGSPPPQLWSAWNTPRWWPLPEGSLESGAPNVLLVKVYGRGEAGISGTLMLDERAAAERAWRLDAFMASDANGVIAVILVVIGSYHLIMWLLRRSDRENLWYALTSLCFAVYLLNFCITRIPGLEHPGFSFDVFQRIIFVALFLVIAFFSEFVREFLRVEDHKVLAVARLLCAALPVAANLVPLDYAAYRHGVVPVTQAFMLLPVAYVVFIMVRAMVRRNREAFILLLGFIPTVVAALFDLVVQQFLQLTVGFYFLGLGFPLLLVAVLFILAHRFVDNQNALTDLNANLERKVADRTRALSDANARLDHANHHLTDTIRQLEAARAVAAKDMAMAVNVQNGILPKAAPRSPDWDIAFAYRPMTGVSGDFYDFYQYGGKLRGLSVFDVSGHGIASGLITMIGRSVIMRSILDLRKQKLDTVIARANRELIAQIGATDNYLTGIVLRFWDDVVEYLNADHPDLLYRRAGGSPSTSVNSRNHDVKGRFLGMDALEAVHRPMSFRVFPGDILLLYTDCLVETRDASGAEYGAERLAASLNTAPTDSAQAVLDHILADFRSFAGRGELGDDLTILAVRRRRPGEDWQAAPAAMDGSVVPAAAEEDFELVISEA
jgi:sigma-B regulation protein RsbU (phosphoserine phosphatase)